MGRRRLLFENNHIYHVFNRGTDKRQIFLDTSDFLRMYENLSLFNTIEGIGNIRDLNEKKKNHLRSQNELVDILAYCLNPNHFHLLLRQKVDEGISKFMERVGKGYARFFNTKYKRSGSLFEGKFKATYVEEGDHLNYVGAYVNLNNEVHGYSDSSLVVRSFEEYSDKKMGLCNDKDSLLTAHPTLSEFTVFSKNTVHEINENKRLKKEREGLLLETP